MRETDHADRADRRSDSRPGMDGHAVTLDDLVLAYMRQAIDDDQPPRRDWRWRDDPLRMAAVPHADVDRAAVLVALAIVSAITGVQLSHLYTSIVTHCQTGCGLAPRSS